MSDITHDGADDGFHEIQLSGKQLVALFMATTCVSVIIFLFGVMVGRDARTGRPDATDAALTTPAPAPAPSPAPAPAAALTTAPMAQQAAAQPAATPAEPPSPPADDELTYRKRLESEGSPAEKLKPQGTSARTEAKPEPARPEPAVAKPVPSPAAAGTTTEPAASGGKPGRWVVQLVALRDRSAASSIVQRLSGKGYPAFMVNPSAATPNQVFKVQVGRYDDRNEAERVSRRLEKEEKFSPWISR